jgi:hypothetical protein
LFDRWKERHHVYLAKDSSTTDEQRGMMILRDIEAAVMADDDGYDWAIVLVRF